MPLHVGEMVADKYRVEAEIGHGAYGRVYRARDIILDRVVAIKELHLGEGDLGSTSFGDYARRFRREAKVQARFNHPNVVQVYELLEPARDTLYLVMEYVDGGSLKERLERRGPLPVDEAVGLARELLAALAAVHADARDIVHRDIKPSNILLTKDGHVKLSDFGLSQVSDESGRSGGGEAHPGTPLYMSPEQEKTSAYLDPASDLYSAGCVLFESLTGMPYKSARRRKQDLRGLRPEVSAWLVDAVAGMLVSESGERANGETMLAKLEAGQRANTEARVRSESERMAVQQHEIKRQTTRLPRLLEEIEEARDQKDWRRLAETGQAVLLIENLTDGAETTARAAVTDGYFQWEDVAYFKSHEFEPLLQELSRFIEASPQHADLFWLRGILRSSQCSYQDRREWAQVIADYSHAIELVPHRAEYYAYRGQGFGRAALKEHALGDYERSIADFSKAIELDPGKADYYSQRGQIYLFKRVRDRAIEDWSRAIELDPGKADYYRKRGLVHLVQSDYDRAIADWNKAIKLEPRRADNFDSRGLSYHLKGDYHRAITDYTKAIKLDPDNADYYESRGANYNETGEYDRAIADYSRAIELNRGKADYYHVRGKSYIFKGDADRAIADWNKAIELDPGQADYYHVRGLFYRFTKDVDRAIADWNKAIELDPNRADYYFERGKSYLDKREYDRAIGDESKAIEIDPSNGRNYYCRGLTYRAMGNPSKGEADLAQARALGYKE